MGSGHGRLPPGQLQLRLVQQPLLRHNAEQAQAAPQRAHRPAPPELPDTAGAQRHGPRVDALEPQPDRARDPEVVHELQRLARGRLQSVERDTGQRRCRRARDIYQELHERHQPHRQRRFVGVLPPLPQRLRVDRRAQCARRLLAEQLYRQHHNLRRRQPSVGFAQREGDKECLRIGKHRPLEVRIPLCNCTQRLVVDHCHGQQLVFLSFCGRQLGDIRLCEAAQVYGLPEGDGVVGNGQQRPRPVPDTAGLHQGEQLGEHSHHQLSVGTGQL